MDRSRTGRWGILGCAQIARVRTVPGLLKPANGELYALASRGLSKAEEFKAMFGAKAAYGSY